MTNLSSNKPAVCVIIVSYNFEPWIHRCIPSVKASTLPAAILVVDNGSDDGTCEIIKREYPEVMLVETHENLGFGRGNNIGMQYAIEEGFDYLFLLNQDAWIASDALERLIAAAEDNSDYAILSPVHLNGRDDATDFGFRDYTGIINREEALQLPCEVTEYPFINAAMWLIPVTIIKEVGMFAPLFAHYGEDRNYVHRVQKKGYRLGVVKSATGCHDRESRPVSRQQWFYAEFVYFLTEAVNPHYLWYKAVAYSLLAALKKALKALLAGKWSDSGAYIRIALRLIGRRRAIRHTRKEEKIRRK